MMNVCQALAEIMKEIGPVAKERVNQMQGYQYRGIDDLYNALNRLFGRYGIITVPEIVQDETEILQSSEKRRVVYKKIHVKYSVIGPDGSSITAIVPGEAMDHSDKAIYKALSGAHKYLLFQLLLVPTAEAEPESDDIQVPIQDPVEKAAPAMNNNLVADLIQKLQAAPTPEKLDAIYYDGIRKLRQDAQGKVALFKAYEACKKAMHPSSPVDKKPKQEEEENDLF